jgi:uncharacterized membrane protein YeaQ/YmgE (transglycosylase-associated protein family)
MNWPQLDLKHFNFWGLGWVNFILLVLVAGLCGGVAKILTGQSRGGCFVSVILGFIGALLALLLDQYVHLPDYATLQVGSTRFPIIWSIIGAAVFVTVLSWFTRSRKTE